MNTFIHSHSSLETYPIGKVYTRFQTKTPQNPPGGGGRRYSGFQVTGMIKDFLGFDIFDSGIFWIVKFGKYYFGWLDLSRDLFWL